MSEHICSSVSGKSISVILVKSYGLTLIMCEGKAISGMATSFRQSKKNAGQVKSFKFWYCQGCMWVYLDVEPKGFQWDSRQNDLLISFTQGRL